MVKSTQTVNVVDVGTNILSSNLRSSFNPTFDADDNAFLFPNHEASNGAGTVGTNRVWNQCVMLLQGNLSCVLGNGSTVKLNEGSAFLTAGCQLSPRDVPGQVVTDVVQATVLLSPRVCVYVVFNLEALRPENQERVEKLWATTIQETRSREERKVRESSQFVRGTGTPCAFLSRPRRAIVVLGSDLVRAELENSAYGSFGKSAVWTGHERGRTRCVV
jgi:hypothetical protein